MRTSYSSLHVLKSWLNNRQHKRKSFIMNSLRQSLFPLLFPSLSLRLL